MRTGKALRLAFAVSLGILFLVSFASLVPAHPVESDETYYIRRAMQNLAFLEGQFPYKQVTFSLPNHPFTGELLMGLGLLVAGQTFTPSPYVWDNMNMSILPSGSLTLSQTHLTAGELYTPRMVSLLIATIAIIALVYLGMKLSLLAGLFGFLFAVTAPGVIDISVMAMLDIYSAAFTVLSILALYWYVKGTRAALLASGIFLGLAVGSKLCLDPFIAAVVIVFCILIREQSTRERVKRLIQNWGLAVAAFAATSPVVVLRFPSELRDSIGSSAARIGLNFWITGIEHDISGFIQPPVLIIYALLTTSAVILPLYAFHLESRVVREASRLRRWRGLASFLRGNPEALFLIAVASFCSLDLMLTPLIQEYDRNLQRLGLYMAFTSSVSMAYLIRNFKWSRVSLFFAVACSAVLLTVGYVFLGTISSRLASETFTYASNGQTIVMGSLAPEASVLLVLSGIFISLVFLGIFGMSLGGNSLPLRPQKDLQGTPLSVAASGGGTE